MDASDFKNTFLPAHRRMYAAAWRLTGNQQEAEDLVQDALLKLWTKRNDLKIPDNPEAFAVTTLRNLFYDRKRKKQPKIYDNEPQEHQLPTGRNAADLLEEKQEAAIIAQIIGQLPDRQRLIITLHDVDNLSYEEIEAQTGLNAINIRVALSRARKAVRAQLKGIIE